MDLADLQSELARGEAANLFTLREMAVERGDACAFALTALRECELLHATVGETERWRRFTDALDRWPHSAPLGDAPALDAALATWPDRERRLPTRWLTDLIDGRPSPFASLARSLDLSASTPEAMCALLEGALRTIAPRSLRALSLYLTKRDRSAADFSSLPALIARCEGVTHLAICLPIRAADLGALLAAARKVGVTSFQFTVASALYRAVLKSKHLAGVRSLSLWMSDGAAGAKSAPFLELLASSPCLPTLEHLALREAGFDDDAMVPLATLPLPSLTSLDLSYNRLSAAGIGALTGARWWPSLRSLTLDWVRRDNYDRLSDAGLAPLFARPPARLEHLSLVGDGVREGAPFVERLPHLTSLNLELNDLRGQGALAVVRHPGLEALELSSNRIDEASVLELARAVTPGPSLRALGLGVTTESLVTELALASAPWAKRAGLRSTPRVLSWLWGLPRVSLTHRVLNGRHQGETAALAASPSLASVTNLALSWEYEPEPADFRALVTSPNASGIESLDLTLGEHWRARPLIAALGDGSFPALRTLALTSLCGATEQESREGASTVLGPLARHARMPSLRELTLNNAKLSATELATLSTGGGLPALSSLHITGWAEGSVTEAFDAVARATHAKSLRELSVDLAGSGEGECEAFKDTSWTRSLERLSLRVAWSSLAPTARFDAPRCRALSLVGISVDRLRCFEASPVEALSLRWPSVTPETLSTLSMWRLRSLAFPDTRLERALLEALMSSAWLAGVERLDLSGCAWSGESMRILGASKHLGGVRHLALGKVLLALDAVTELLSSDALPNLTALALDHEYRSNPWPEGWKTLRPGLSIVAAS